VSVGIRQGGHLMGLRPALIGSFSLVLLAFSWSGAAAQQFNSDNWWVLPHTTGMGLVSLGEQYTTGYLGYGFLPGWELDVAATLYPADEGSKNAHYSTTTYVKRLIVENEALTNGASVMAGVGQGPGYYDSGVLVQDLKSYWACVPVTISLFDNLLSWDLMPGGTWNTSYGPAQEHASAFTYSSRLAIYKIIPRSAIVGEVFGAEGDADSPAQYKAGVRWESKYAVIALTYGDGLEGNQGAGLELGFIFLTVPYKDH